MILVKNKLKKVKNKYDDDEYLNYLKYSHLEPTTTKGRTVEVSDKATQEPDILNNFSQTIIKDMVDKETDTYDELNKIIGDYILKMSSKNFKSKEPSRAEKMTQAFTKMIEQRDRKKSSSSSSGSDSDGFLAKSIRRGIRLAELTGNALTTTFGVASDVADFLAEATVTRQQQASEEEVASAEALRGICVGEEAEEVASSSHDEPNFRRERSRSRDDTDDYEPDDDVGNRLLRRGASRSRSSTPKGYGTKSPNRQGGYPKKKK